MQSLLKSGVSKQPKNLGYFSIRNFPQELKIQPSLDTLVLKYLGHLLPNDDLVQLLSPQVFDKCFFTGAADLKKFRSRCHRNTLFPDSLMPNSLFQFLNQRLAQDREGDRSISSNSGVLGPIECIIANLNIYGFRQSIM